MSVSANGLTGPFSVQTKNIIQTIISWQGEQMNLLNSTLHSLQKQVVKTEISKMKLKNTPHKKCSRHRLAAGTHSVT